MDEQEEQDHLITNTKALAGKLNRSVDYHKNLATVKGNEELIRKLKDLFSDFDEHEEKLRLTISTSSYVQRNLASLHTTMTEVDTFLTDLANSRTLFFSKTRIKNKLYNILHALRAKNTQLMTSVTLELLSRARKPGNLPISAPLRPANTVEFDLGYAFFYGICRPKNYVLAVEHFREAAKQGDSEAMYMLAECYSEELGIEKDEHLSSEWIEKAAALNCPGAIHKQAMSILRALEFAHPDNVHKILGFFESQEINLNDTVTGSEMDEMLSPLSTTRSRGKSTSPTRSPTKSTVSSSRIISPDRVRKSERNRSSMTMMTMEDIADDARIREEEDGLNLELSVQLLLKAAEFEHVAAKTDLGILFELASDDEKALKWFTLASNGGCPKATNRLGLLYFHGKGTTKNLDRAFSLFVSAARSGDRDANNNAGACLEQGLGTELRPAAALSFYMKGAEQESPQAMYSLGYLLIRSSVKAIEDLTVAREMQLVHGMADWDRRGAFSTLKDKYSKGKVPAGLFASHRGPDGSGGNGVIGDNGVGGNMGGNGYNMGGNRGNNIGRNFEVGFGVTSLPKGRKSIDSTSSNEGDSGGGKGPIKPPRPAFMGSSSLNIAPFESNGNNTLSLIIPSRTRESRSDLTVGADPLEVQVMKAEEQVKEGVRWLRAAAERGVLDARYQLGLVYQQGMGCPSDLPSALSQYEYAAKEGHARAAVAAGNILYDNLRKEHSSSSASNTPSKHIDYNDSITDSRYRRVLDLYRVAAVGGVPEAMNCLGLLLEDGRGSAGRLPDVQEAASWYMEACICGIHDSAMNLALLLSKGTVDSIRSLDGIQHFTLEDAVNWLKKYSREVDMPIPLQDEFAMLLAQLSTDIANGGNGYNRNGSHEKEKKGLEKEKMDQFEDSNGRDGRDGRENRGGYAGVVTMDPVAIRRDSERRDSERRGSGIGSERGSEGRGSDRGGSDRRGSEVGIDRRGSEGRGSERGIERRGSERAGQLKDGRDGKDDYGDRERMGASREMDQGKQDRERLKERERAREWEAEKEREREGMFGQRTMHERHEGH